MRSVLDTILSTGTAIGTSLAATTIASGDSFTLRNASRVSILAPWLSAQAAGFFGIMAGSMHDPTYGLQGHHAAACPFPIVPFMHYLVGSRDTLVCKASDSATSGDICNLVIPVLYEDPVGLPAGNYIFPIEKDARSTKRVATAYATHTAATTVGYGGSKALSAYTHQIPGGKNYAILGAISSLNQAAITIKGPCTGNFRIAIPGSLLYKERTAQWFVDMSFMYNRPFIPVINSNDFSSTIIETVNDENAASPVIHIYMEELVD